MAKIKKEEPLLICDGCKKEFKVLKSKGLYSGKQFCTDDCKKKNYYNGAL